MLLLDGLKAILQPLVSSGSFLAGYEDYSELVRVVGKSSHQSPFSQMLMSDAIAKQIHLDTGIVCEMYNYVSNELIVEQNKALMEMSNSVTEIWERILLYQFSKIAGKINLRKKVWKYCQMLNFSDP